MLVGWNKVDWEVYCKLRNQVTKMNRKKKILFFKIKYDCI